MQGHNRWPEAPRYEERHREALNQYFTDASRVSRGVTRGLSIALGEEEEYLDGFCESGETISLMRLFKYYPYEKAPPASSFHVCPCIVNHL